MYPPHPSPALLSLLPQVSLALVDFLHDPIIALVVLFDFVLSAYCSDLDDPEGVAYDWINKRLYFTDYHKRNVQSIGMEGLNRSIVAHANRPRGIVVDPCYG